MLSILETYRGQAKACEDVAHMTLIRIPDFGTCLSTQELLSSIDMALLRLAVAKTPQRYSLPLTPDGVCKETSTCALESELRA